MIHLSVNINKVALLRNSRASNIPNVVLFAEDAANYGANGITVHPRPDERHITKKDVYELAKKFPNEDTEFNIEGYPTKQFLNMVCDVKPSQVTFVPDTEDQITSDHGWDVIKNEYLLREAIAECKRKGIRTSLFMDPNKKQLEAAKKVGTDRIEFYTGPYALAYEKATIMNANLKPSIQNILEVLSLVNELHLGINAGHDLNLKNLHFFASKIPNLLEVSIGHALVSDCLIYGLENTINMYKLCLQ